MVRSRFAVALIAALLLGSEPASAQVPRSFRDGFWIGAGVGGGWVRVSCDICIANRGFGFASQLRVGDALREDLLIGLEANAWGRSEEGVDEILATLTAGAQWYTRPHGGFYLKGGFGLVSYRADADEDDDGALTSIAFGPQFGIGYDLRIGPSLSLSPYFNALIAPIGGELKFEGELFIDDVNLTLIQFGLALTKH